MKENYIGFDPALMDGDHSFLSEELLIPWCNHTDTIRVNMVDSHLVQSIVLNKPEVPKVATGFEKQVGKYSSSYKLAESELVIEKVIKKHKRRRLYIMTDPETRTVHVADIPSCRNITEYYGYKVIDLLRTKKEGDTVAKGDGIYSCPSYDKNYNFGYGVNLKAIFLAYKGLTYEDAIVISESGAAKLETTTVKEIKVTLNTNDVLVNLYGNQNHYKGFPKIGEEIKDGVLCARRRIVNESVLHDFSTERMSEIEPNLDDIFYIEGTIVDIEIFSNVDASDLKKNDSFQILSTLTANSDYYEEITAAIEELQKEKYTLSEDASFIYKRAVNMINDEASFCTDNGKTDFDNIIIKFMVECRRSLKPGDY